jgi:hypothetical protein
MRNPRDLFHDLVHRPLDPSVPLVLKRFTVRLAILLIFCSLPITGGIGFKRMFLALTGINAIMCVIWALLRRERPKSAGLTHWDEALVMAILWLTAQLAS